MSGRIIRVLTTCMALVLTAKLGRITYLDRPETWYNLRMNRIVERADSIYGLSDVYEVREDGVKTYNGFVIVAADWNLHPYGTLVETSLGTGIVLDTGTFEDRETIDIATSWGKGGNE